MNNHLFTLIGIVVVKVHMGNIVVDFLDMVDNIFISEFLYVDKTRTIVKSVVKFIFSLFLKNCNYHSTCRNVLIYINVIIVIQKIKSTKCIHLVYRFNTMSVLPIFRTQYGDIWCLMRLMVFDLFHWSTVVVICKFVQ